MLLEGVEGVHVDLSVGPRDAQVPLRRQDGGAEARGAASRPGGPGRDPAGPRRRQAASARRRERTACPADQVQRLRQEEAGPRDQDEGVRGETGARRQGSLSVFVAAVSVTAVEYNTIQYNIRLFLSWQNAAQHERHNIKM